MGDGGFFPQGPPGGLDPVNLGLMELINEIISFLVSLVNWIWNNLLALLDDIVFVFQTLGKVIWQAVQFVWNGIGKVAGFFKSVWTGFIKPIIARVFTFVRKVQLWLETKLAPIINFIKTVRRYWDLIFKVYIKPILKVLQQMRQVLGVLRALGFKWAGALDKRIAQIEGQITQIFSQVRGILNGMLDLLNQVCDPLRLLRRPMLVLSFRRTIHSLIRLTTGLPPGYFFPSPRSGVAAGIGFLQKEFNKADPGQNPPASAYLKGDDGLGGFSGYSAGVTPDDTDVDSAAMLDFFNDDLWPDPKFDDPANALDAAIQGALSGSLVNV